MKKIVCILINLFCWFQLDAQDTAFVDIVNWAGGVCCSSGDRYTIHFKVAQPGYDVDSIELNIDGMGYKLKCLQSMEIRPDEYVFGFNITHLNYNVLDGLQTYFEGIEANDIFPLSVNYELLRIHYSNGKTRNAPIVVRREILAYP
jgi:hypothetical protein